MDETLEVALEDAAGTADADRAQGTNLHLGVDMRTADRQALRHFVNGY